MKNIPRGKSISDPVTELFQLAAGLRFISKALENEWGPSRKDLSEGACWVVKECANRVTDIATLLWDEEYQPEKQSASKKL